MKKITMKQIMALEPCENSDPLQYADKDWEGTVLDILRHPDVPPVNKIWVVVRSPYLTKAQSVAFAGFCAEQAKQFSDAGAAASYASASASHAAHAADAADAADAAADAAYAASRGADVRAAQVEKLIDILVCQPVGACDPIQLPQ